MTKTSVSVPFSEVLLNQASAFFDAAHAAVALDLPDWAEAVTEATRAISFPLAALLALPMQAEEIDLEVVRQAAQLSATSAAGGQSPEAAGLAMARLGARRVFARQGELAWDQGFVFQVLSRAPRTAEQWLEQWLPSAPEDPQQRQLFWATEAFFARVGRLGLEHFFHLNVLNVTPLFACLDSLVHALAQFDTDENSPVTGEVYSDMATGVSCSPYSKLSSDGAYHLLYTLGLALGRSPVVVARDLRGFGLLDQPERGTDAWRELDQSVAVMQWCAQALAEAEAQLHLGAREQLVMRAALIRAAHLSGRPQDWAGPERSMAEFCCSAISPFGSRDPLEVLRRVERYAPSPSSGFPTVDYAALFQEFLSSYLDSCDRRRSYSALTLKPDAYAQEVIRGARYLKRGETLFCEEFSLHWRAVEQLQLELPALYAQALIEALCAPRD